MNNIDLVGEYDSKLIVRTEKYNKYIIFHQKKRYKHSKQFTGTGNIGVVYDSGNKLLFVKRRYYFSVTDKRFFNRGEEIFSIKVKNNKIVIYSIIKHLNQIRHASIVEVVNSAQFCKIGLNRFKKILKNFLKRYNLSLSRKYSLERSVLNNQYPCLKTLVLSRNQFPRNSFYGIFNESDIDSAIKKSFGYKTPKLRKMVYEILNKEQSVDVLRFGFTIKNLFPIDYCHQILEKGTPSAFTRRDNKFYKAAKEFFKKINPIKLKNFLKKSNEPIQFVNDPLVDSIRMYMRLKNIPNVSFPEDYRTIGDLHNRFVELIKNNENEINHFPLKIKEYLQPLNNLIVGDFRFEVPNHSKKLAEYSGLLHQCVSSYAQKINSGGCEILAVYVKDQLEYNLEIVNKNIIQFSGKYNAKPDEKHRQLIIDILKKYNIKTEDRFSFNPIPQQDLAPQNNQVIDCEMF